MSLTKKNILAFDTATNACSVALQVGDKLFSQHKIVPREHARLLLPMIQAVLDEANLDLNALNAIAFGCGPGSFMGVRLATATAQGLAFGLNIPVIPVSTLQVIAQTAYAQFPAKNILAGWDARMDEIYWGLYAVDSSGVMHSSTQDNLSPPGLIDTTLFTKLEFCTAGNAWSVYAEKLQSILPQAQQSFTDIYPEARSMLTIANKQFLSGEFVSPEKAEPHYVRHHVVHNHN